MGINTYTATFVDGDQIIDMKAVEYGALLYYPEDPLKTGYTFDAWYSDPEFTIPCTIETMPAEDITIYAKYVINEYSVRFVDGNQIIDMKFVEYGTQEILPSLTKTGYVLRGWSTSSTGTVDYAPYATIAISDDTTLYAVWKEAESYLVREDTLVNIANAIRKNTNTSASITLNDMATKVMSIKPFESSISSVTITNNLSAPLEFHTYDASGGFVKTTVAATTAETHNLHEGVLVFSLPFTAKVTTVGAETDITNALLAAGAYCIGLAGTLSLSISA